MPFSLSDPVVINVVVPFISVGASILLKVNSRRDDYQALKKEDVAIGLDLAVTALIIYIVRAADEAQKALASNTPPNVGQAQVPWMLLFFLVGIILVNLLTRKFGWKGEGELNWFCGIIVPFVFGLGCLLYVLGIF